MKGLFKGIKWLVCLVYPKMERVGTENLPDEPCIIVGNHTQMYGPIACELYFSDNCYIWCAGQMMNLKDVPAYAYNNFWSQKPKYSKWFYRIISYIIAPWSVLIFSNARTIPVYRDTRMLTTFRDTITKLKEGNNAVIFPEYDVKYNNIIYDFQDKFIDVARLYHKRTGKLLSFVPLYIAPKLKTMYLGKPIRFCPNTPFDEERRRICEYLMAKITDIARDLPEHTVVPYRNIPKRHYPSNKTNEVEYCAKNQL